MFLPIAGDGDPETRLRHERVGFANRLTIRWTIPGDTYRIVHRGHAKKNAGSTTLTACTASSPSFSVEP